jgi:hypothetical protein
MKNPKKFVSDFFKVLFLSNYERKGIYWIREYEFNNREALLLLKAYNLKQECDSDFLKLILNPIEEYFFEETNLDNDFFFEFTEKFSTAYQDLDPNT